MSAWSPAGPRPTGGSTAWIPPALLPSWGTSMASGGSHSPTMHAPPPCPGWPGPRAGRLPGHDSHRSGDRGRGLMRTSAAITYRLRRLERAGLIARLADPLDGRGVLVALTDRGRRLTDLVAPDHLENERGLLAALTAGEQAELTRHLRKLLVAFESEQLSP